MFSSEAIPFISSLAARITTRPKSLYNRLWWFRFRKMRHSPSLDPRHCETPVAQSIRLSIDCRRQWCALLPKRRGLLVITPNGMITRLAESRVSLSSRAWTNNLQISQHCVTIFDSIVLDYEPWNHLDTLSSSPLSHSPASWLLMGRKRVHAHRSEKWREWRFTVGATPQPANGPFPC